MKYARIQNGTVVELLVAPEGFSIQQCFHPDVLAGGEFVPNDVQHGWVKQEDGSFAAPVEETTTDTTDTTQ